MNPANIGVFMFVDGLITSLLFSVFLVLDVFKAAYMTDATLHPVMMAMTLYLDILNIIMGLLEMRVGTELKNNDQSSSLGNFCMSLFGFLLPIMLGVYLVYDAFWGSSNENNLSPNNKSGHTLDNIPVAEPVVYPNQGGNDDSIYVGASAYYANQGGNGGSSTAM